MQTNTSTGKQLPTIAGVLVLTVLATLLIVVTLPSQAQQAVGQSAITVKASHPAPRYLIRGSETISLPRGMTQTVEVYRADLGSWQYDASPRKEFGQDILSIAIRFDDSSVASLKAYAETNRQLATQLATEGGAAHVMVTFRSYLAPEQFRAWVAKYAIRGDATLMNPALGVMVEMRATEANGLRATADVWLGIKGQPDPLLQSSIDDLIAPHNPGIKPPIFNGIFMTRGEVDAKQLPMIANDPLVFVADVTTEYATRDLAAAQVKGANEVDSDERSPIWRMEDYGLQNFR